MNNLDDLIEKLNEVPENAIARSRDRFKEHMFECGKLCADAKTALEYLKHRTQILQKENQKLKQGTKTLVKAINDFERYLNI